MVVLLIGPILFILLILFAVKQQKRGMAGWKAALMVLAGSGLIVVLLFGILMWGFQNFG